MPREGKENGWVLDPDGEPNVNREFYDPSFLLTFSLSAGASQGH